MTSLRSRLWKPNGMKMSLKHNQRLIASTGLTDPIIKYIQFHWKKLPVDILLTKSRAM